MDQVSHSRPQARPGAEAGEPQLDAGGLAFCVIAAACFGGITTFARLAYDGGAAPLTLIVGRTAVALLLISLLMLALKRRVRVAPRNRKATFFISLGFGLVSFCYLSAVFFIPVSLAALIFYLYPLIVAITIPALDGRRLGGAAVLAFGTAFVGLALALGPAFQSLDWRGLLLAFGAALSLAFCYVLRSRALADLDSLTLSFWLNLIGTVVFLPTLLLPGTFALPETSVSWAGLTGACLAYSVAVVTQFVAIGRAGATRTALILNLEPVISILAAAALLGERLSPLQIAGVALVLLAVMTSARARLTR
ncbi:MAG: DMT family transporter [Kiloniellales bacterium]